MHLHFISPSGSQALGLSAQHQGATCEPRPGKQLQRGLGLLRAERASFGISVETPWCRDTKQTQAMESASPRSRSLDLETFRVTAKPSRISSHQPYQGSPFADVGDLHLHYQGQESCAPTQPAPTLSPCFHQHPKKLLWDKSHPIGPQCRAFHLLFLPPPNCFRHETFFPAHAFLKDTVRFCINKEMRHDSSRLRRKYHNHPNNINSLEKTLGAVNTLR